MPVLYRYMFRELISPFGVTLLFFTSIFVMTRIPDITNMVVNYNTGISAVFLLILYSLPRFLEFTLPMSVMLAVLLTTMRMAGSNEIIALKGGGMTIYRLLPPVGFFCFLVALVTLWVTVWAVPWGKYAFSTTGAELARSSLNMALKARQFNTPFDDVMIYVNAVDVKTGNMRDLFIEDGRNDDTVGITVAARGKLVVRPGQEGYTLRLANGTINQVSLSRKTAHQIHFDTYDINFDMPGAGDGNRAGNPSRDLDEMGIGELTATMNTPDISPKKRNEAKLVFHEKFAIPFACMVLGLLSLCLGLQSLSSRKGAGFGMALFFFLGYYMLLAFGWSAGETGKVSPVLAMWLPNVVLGIMALYMLRRVVREAPLQFPDMGILWKTKTGSIGKKGGA